MQQTFEAVESQSPPPESNKVPSDKPWKVEPVLNYSEPTGGTVKKCQIQLSCPQEMPCPLTVQPELRLLKIPQTLTDVWVDHLFILKLTIAGHNQLNTGNAGLTKDRLLLLLEEMKKGLSSPRLLRLLEEMKKGLNNQRSLLWHRSSHQFPNLSPLQCPHPTYLTLISPVIV